MQEQRKSPNQNLIPLQRSGSFVTGMVHALELRMETHDALIILDLMRGLVLPISKMR